MAGYKREPNGKRFLIHGGMDIFRAPDLIREGFWPYLQNIRQRIMGRITGRPTTGAALYTYPSAPNTIVRLNDTTPNGPASGFVRIIATDSGALYVNGTEVDSGLSGQPPSICINQPDQSVQPWAYIADSSMATVIVSDSQQCTGMIKLRSDMLTRKTGIKEPQYPVQVSINVDSSSLWLSLPATTPPWTNIGGVNADYDYNGTDTQPPYPAIIATPVGGATVQLWVTGTATVNGTPGTLPGASQPSSTGYPGDFIASPVTVVYAFTDANGNIIAQSTAVGAPQVVGNVGAGITLTVPYGAAQLQIGIDSQGAGNTPLTHPFSANSGSYLVQALVSTSAITQVSSIVGIINAAIWGDSPHGDGNSGYIWKNPNDQGTGISRTTGTAQATSSNNSLIFDSTPEDGTVPVQWSTLNSSGSTIGSVALFSPALESDGYQDFNACITGSLWVPQGGTYSIQIQYKDQIMFGVGGGATLRGSVTTTGGGHSPVTQYSPFTGELGQTITVVDGLPLLYVGYLTGGSSGTSENTFQVSTLSVTFPAAGIYPFEIDWDYWYHSGRSLIVEMDPTPGAGVALIPPLPMGVRTNVQYWAKPRATETGAQGNPGPASTIQQTPVLADLITSPYQTDPQVTVMDYYRQDDGLPNPTYVITGPNDGLGPVINGIQYNTQVEDALSDIAAANNQLMQLDDYEPFPTIGVPLAGKVTIVAGVVTWKSGDKFPLNMLAGTLMLIGSPAQNAYSLVSRPTSATTIVIPDVPDTIGDSSGDGVPYNIAQPILAQQPTQSMWGPDAYGFFHAIDPTTNAYVWTKANNPDSAPQTNRLLLTSPSETLMGGGLINGISIAFSTEHHWLMYPNFADAQATTLGIQGNQWNPILGSGKRGMFIRNCGCALGGKAFAFRASDGICITNGGGDESITDETLWNLFPHENFTPAPVTLGPFTVYPPSDSLCQTLTYQNGYIYWDYRDVNGNRRTLVYGEAEHGWMVDVGQYPFTAHSSEYAPNVNDTAVGCNDNSLRVLQSGGTEVCMSMVGTVPDNSGDVRAPKRVSDVFVRAVVDAAGPVTVGLYANQFATPLSGFAPASLTGSDTLAPYIVDFGSNQPQDVIDLEAVFSWNTSSGTQLDLWQPGFMPLPISILSRVTDALTHGLSDWQGVCQIDLMYFATAPVTITMNLDGEAYPATVTQTWPAAGSLFVPAKIALKMPPNKFKTCSWQIQSSAPFYLFDCLCWIGAWERAGDFKRFNPFKMAKNTPDLEA